MCWFFFFQMSQIWAQNTSWKVKYCDAFIHLGRWNIVSTISEPSHDCNEEKYFKKTHCFPKNSPLMNKCSSWDGRHIFWFFLSFFFFCTALDSHINLSSILLSLDWTHTTVKVIHWPMESYFFSQVNRSITNARPTNTRQFDAKVVVFSCWKFMRYPSFYQNFFSLLIHPACTWFDWGIAFFLRILHYEKNASTQIKSTSPAQRFALWINCFLPQLFLCGKMFNHPDW